jgi:hypothetical protein
MHTDILLGGYFLSSKNTDILLGGYFLSSKITKGLTPLKRMSEFCSSSIESRAYKAEVNHMLFSPIL